MLENFENLGTPVPAFAAAERQLMIIREIHHRLQMHGYAGRIDYAHPWEFYLVSLVIPTIFVGAAVAVVVGNGDGVVGAIDGVGCGSALNVSTATPLL